MKYLNMYIYVCHRYHLPRSFLKSKDNLLVIFDEAGGDINTVQIETVNRDSICSIIDEDWPADVWSWKRKGNEIVPEGDTPQVKASLKCPKDKVINRVEFASFGNPIGVCGFYLLGNCTSPNSVKIVEQVTFNLIKPLVTIYDNLRFFVVANKRLSACDVDMEDSI